MKKLILHIPHSSTNIPFYDGYLVDRTTINDEILKLTDWYTDDLYISDNAITVKADFSRIFCDVERFLDDKQEIMAQFGMGALYEKTDGGEKLRDINTFLRKRILNKFYKKHHIKLSNAVNEQLDIFGDVTILDCHSFPDKAFKRDINQKLNRPDFNIGTDQYHTPVEFIEKSVRFFKDKGYSLGIDNPYSGTIVPLEHLNKTANVKSIMLEINKKLYLNESTNNKSDSYLKVKKVVRAYIEMINIL